MEKITARKDELLNKLIANRADHRAIFEEALEGFQAKVREEADRLAVLAREGSKTDVRITLRAPEDHTRDYDRAIAMVQMNVGDTIDLLEHDFAQYVMDDWGWQGTFLSNVYGSQRARGKFGDSYVVS